MHSLNPVPKLYNHPFCYINHILVLMLYSNISEMFRPQKKLRILTNCINVIVVRHSIKRILLVNFYYFFIISELSLFSIYNDHGKIDLLTIM